MARAGDPIVEVRWHDATGSSGWRQLRDHIESESGHDGCMAIRTVGLLVQKTSKSVVVAQSRDAQGKLNEVLAIPAKCVIGIRTFVTCGRNKKAK